MLKYVYGSVSCNRTPNSVDWGEQNEICFATCNGIALVDAKRASVVDILTGHKDRVNCVVWVRGGLRAIVSGSTDQTCIMWKADKNDALQPSCVLKGHTGSVTAVDAMVTPSRQLCVVSAAADSNIKLWQGDLSSSDLTVTSTQTISFGSGFALNVAFTLVPNTQVLMLACGGDDHKVYLYVEQNSQMVSVMTLFGHEDWVRGLHFNTTGSELRLASCSQDNYIRIWKFSARDQGGSGDSLDLDQGIRLKENTFNLKQADVTCHYSVSLESVLMGHDNWVYSVNWQNTDNCEEKSPCLLSASMDKTMVIWRADPQSGLWLEQARVGEVGGNTLGLYGGVFSPDGNSVLSHGYQGALQLYTYSQESSMWEPQVICGGHFGPVEDIAWQPDSGHYLLSVSADQTTRCHGFWNTDEGKSGWYEIARPQVHGYNMNCLTAINKYCFASGADEKVIRVFEASRNFVDNLSRVSGLNLNDDLEARPEGASVPALGLSNKAVKQEEVIEVKGHAADSHPNEQYPEHYFTPVQSDRPATEVNLIQNTLWPEAHKLYGHGYEVFALACNPQGTLLASACKASKADHAGVMIWSCDSWRHLYTLDSHLLTVTQLVWSPSGHYLLSVSRDRTWALFVVDDSSGALSRSRYTDKKTCVHSRIIWSAAWTHDDHYFITVSRDKKAVVWNIEGNVCGSLTFKDSVTAVDVAPCMTPDNRYIVAFGLDNGWILLYTWADDSEWRHCTTLENRQAHQLTVKRLKFSPTVVNGNVNLASCSADHVVKIYELNTNVLDKNPNNVETKQK